jgi:hypothetical protein
MRKGLPRPAGFAPIGALMLIALMTAPADAQSVGFSVDGNCAAGACPPSTPLAVGGETLAPFSFTVTEDNGDSYSFTGEVGEQSENNATYLPGSYSYLVTYLGNSAGGASGGATFTIHVFYDFVANAGVYNMVASTGGGFGGGVADGTSVTSSWTFPGGLSSSTFGPFTPPNPFSQSQTIAVPGPANGEMTADFLTTLVFGAGSPVGAEVVVSGGPVDVLAASILPGGRSVQVGADATVFATILNAGTTSLSNCQIQLPPDAPAGLSLGYQTTDSATNALTGTPNTPVAIAANGAQSYLLDFQASGALSVTNMPVFFDCDYTNPAAVTVGVNTIDLLFSTTPIPDIIALAATATNDGTVHVANGVGAFAVATDNAGAAGTLTASVDTGSAVLPASVELCATTADGQCLSAPAASVPVDFAAGATPTFSIFVSATGSIPFDPGGSRVFVRFLDSDGVSHGSTSVAVTTD